MLMNLDQRVIHIPDGKERDEEGFHYWESYLKMFIPGTLRFHTVVGPRQMRLQKAKLQIRDTFYKKISTQIGLYDLVKLNITMPQCGE